MEDTKRLRTKLRLDLNEVEKQINELEKTVRKDKSEENIQALEKLKDYEKKLKAEYEKMTGISVDQASTLKESRTPSFGGKEGFMSKLFGLLAGLALFNGFYNIALHGITGFTPNDLMDYYSGSGESHLVFRTIAASIRYETSQIYVTAPLAAAVLFSLISTFTSKKGSSGLKFLDTLGIAGIVGLFFYLTILPETDEEVVTAYEENYIYFALLFLIVGILYVMSTMDGVSGLSKFSNFLAGVCLIAVGVQLVLIYITAADVTEQLLIDWPWVMLPAMLSGIFSAIASFFR